MLVEEGCDAPRKLVLEAGLEVIVANGVGEQVGYVVNALGELLVPVIQGAHLIENWVVGPVVGCGWGIVAVIVQKRDEVHRGSALEGEGSWGCGRCGYPRVT
jgi:putative heme iron utilization protein